MIFGIVTLHNHIESLVSKAVRHYGPRYPDVAENENLLADVACLALNHLPPRYIPYQIDLNYRQSVAARMREAKAIKAAVLAAFERIAARTASSAHATPVHLYSSARK